MEEVKGCTKCGDEYPLDQFYKMKQKNGKYYHHSMCKPCLKTYRKEKYGNTDYDKNYHKKNQDKILAYQKQYYDENTEKVSERSKKKYADNKEEYAKSHIKWKKKNPKAFSAYNAIARAKRDGTLIVPDNCTCCDRKIRVEFHHRTYDEPLKGLFLCRKIHRTFHLGVCQITQKLIRKLWRDKYGESYD